MQIKIHRPEEITVRELVPGQVFMDADIPDDERYYLLSDDSCGNGNLIAICLGTEDSDLDLGCVFRFTKNNSVLVCPASFGGTSD